MVGQLGRESFHCAPRIWIYYRQAFRKGYRGIKPNLQAIRLTTTQNLTIEEGGFVTLRILWSEHRSKGSVPCHDRGALLRAVYYRYGMSSVNDLSAWVIAGLGKLYF